MLTIEDSITDENRRISFYLHRSKADADEFVARTYRAYRKMLFDPRSPASIRELRNGYIGSCIAFRRYAYQ